jgi:hypothetical protein
MRRVIIVAVAGLALLAFGFMIFMTGNNKEPTTNKKEVSVELSGTSDSTELDPSDNEAARVAITDMIKANEPDSGSAYVVVVRKNSISRSTTSAGLPKLRYLVDIPQLQRTFVVEREGDETSDFASLYVLCPEANDLRYQAKKCVNQE